MMNITSLPNPLIEKHSNDHRDAKLIISSQNGSSSTVSCWTNFTSLLWPTTVSGLENQQCALDWILFQTFNYRSALPGENFIGNHFRKSTIRIRERRKLPASASWGEYFAPTTPNSVNFLHVCASPANSTWSGVSRRRRFVSENSHLCWNDRASVTMMMVMMMLMCSRFK